MPALDASRWRVRGPASEARGDASVVRRGGAFRGARGARLVGAVDVGGAKNSALKLMAAALLAEGDHDDHERARTSSTSRSWPSCCAASAARSTVDAPTGAVSDRRPRGARARGRLRPGAPAAGLDQRARAAGRPLPAARSSPLPGGDAIGSRPLDMHMAGLRKLGATDRDRARPWSSPRRRDGLHGAQIWLDFPSVGATENLLMAAVLAEGTTVIDNAAREPEIVDLCPMLQRDGREDRRRRAARR